MNGHTRSGASPAAHVMRPRPPRIHAHPSRSVALIATAALATAAVFFWLAVDSSRAPIRPAPAGLVGLASGRGQSRAAPAPRAATPQAPRPPAIPRGPGRLVARVRRATWLSPRPGKPAVARLLSRTEFGTPRTLSVVRRRGEWLGVIAKERPNGRLGWVHLDTSLELSRVRHSIDVDLSRRKLTLRRDGRSVRRFAVAVGAPHTPTPTGRFAVTDRLRTSGSSPYGCCVLALSGTQRYLEPGWSGGNRIAIHGTIAPSTVGRPVTRGCMRAKERDIRRLLTNAPPGTVVSIEP